MVSRKQSHPSQVPRCDAPLPQLWLGVIAHDEANVAMALRLTESGIRLAPHYEWAHFCMATALEMAGRTEEAVDKCDRRSSSIQIFRPDMPNSAETLQPLDDRRKPLGPAEWPCASTPRDPSNWERHSSLAISHFVAGDDEAATREARTAAQARPELPEPLIILAAAASPP
jgi:hypothetical protein